MKYTKIFTSPLALLSSLLLGAVASVVLTLVSAAGSASFSLSPSGTSQAKDTQFNVAVYENGGNNPIISVEASVTYDAAKLQFVGIDAAGSAFDSAIGGGGGNGTVTIIRYRSPGSPGVTGNQLVAKVNFKVLAGSGSTTITVGGNSHILSSNSSGEMWNGTAASTSITLTTPASPQPPSTPTPPATTPTPPKTGGSGGSSNTSSGGNTSSRPSGSSSQNGNSNGSSANTNTNSGGSTEMNTEAAPTGAANNNAGTGLVAISVTNKENKPVIGASVTLGQDSVVTDATGIASFTSVVEGAYTVKVTTEDGNVGEKKINVVPGTIVQKYQVIVKPKSMLPYYIGGGAGLFLLLVVIIWAIKKVKSRPNLPSYPHSDKVVISDLESSNPVQTTPAIPMEQPKVASKPSQPADPDTPPPPPPDDLNGLSVGQVITPKGPPEED